MAAELFHHHFTAVSDKSNPQEDVTWEKQRQRSKAPTGELWVSCLGKFPCSKCLGSSRVSAGGGPACTTSRTERGGRHTVSSPLFSAGRQDCTICDETEHPGLSRPLLTPVWPREQTPRADSPGGNTGSSVWMILQQRVTTR